MELGRGHTWRGRKDVHREVREPERGEPDYECGEAPRNKGRARLMGSGQNRLQLTEELRCLKVEL